MSAHFCAETSCRALSNDVSRLVERSRCANGISYVATGGSIESGNAILSAVWSSHQSAVNFTSSRGESFQRIRS